MCEHFGYWYGTLTWPYSWYCLLVSPFNRYIEWYFTNGRGMWKIVVQIFSIRSLDFYPKIIQSEKRNEMTWPTYLLERFVRFDFGLVPISSALKSCNVILHWNVMHVIFAWISCACISIFCSFEYSWTMCDFLRCFFFRCRYRCRLCRRFHVIKTFRVCKES